MQEYVAAERRGFMFKGKNCLRMAVLLAAIGVSSFTVSAEPQYDIKVTDEEYGAIGNDNKADNEALQKAFNKVKGSDKMVTIYIPEGTYLCEKPLIIYSNTHIVLDSKAVVKRSGVGIDGNLLHNVDDNGKMDQVGGYDMSHDIIIEGGTWDGGELSAMTVGTDVLRIDHAKNVTFKNCTMKNAYDGHILELVGVKNGIVTGCTFTGFRYSKGKENNYQYAREALQLEGAWTEKESDPTSDKGRWAKGSVVDGTGCSDITVSDNTFINMPSGVGQHRLSKSGKARNTNVVISNNKLTCSSDMKACKTAITCSGMDGLTVSGNTVEGPYRIAIHAVKSTDVNIQSNNISDIRTNTIVIENGEISSLTDNTIDNSGKHGISIVAGKIEEISNNTINSPKKNGINFMSGTIQTVSENEINSAGGNGIVSAKGSKTTAVTIKSLSDNTINKAKGSGIVVEAGKITNINNNTIKNVSKHGISAIGGTIGNGKKKNTGIVKNTITTCKINGITVSLKVKLSAVNGNKVTGAKKNGISVTPSAKVSYVVNNTVKKCKVHPIWIGVKGVKESGNKTK